MLRMPLRFFKTSTKKLVRWMSVPRLLFGAGSAALDSVLPAQLAKSLTGPVKAGIVEKVLEKSGMDKGILRLYYGWCPQGYGCRRSN